MGFPMARQLRPHLQAGATGAAVSIPGSGRPRAWRRAWQPMPAFLPGESHGQRSLAGYSPRGCKESETIERLTPFQRHYIIHISPVLVRFI